MVSYLDRPERRHDLADWAHIVENSISTADDRRFSSVMFDHMLSYEQASPFLLGAALGPGRRYDASLCRKSRERSGVTMYNSVGIPGLAMAASEFPELPGFLRLDNPGVGHGSDLEGEYFLEDLARLHADALAATSLAGSVSLLGISMGAAILAVIASKFRSVLPENCKFFFIVPSPNSDNNPAITEERLQQWLDVGRSTAAIELSLRDLFSSKFLAESGEKVERYVAYRLGGGNRQSYRSFYHQVNALRSCDAGSHFERVNPTEAIFVHAEDDRLFPPCHAAEIRKRCPLAQHFSIPNLGHMVHVERPDLIGACLTGMSLGTDHSC